MKKEALIYKFVSNEKSKKFNTVNKIISKLLKNNFTRQDCIIAFGGGITGDLSGLYLVFIREELNLLTSNYFTSPSRCEHRSKTGINHEIYGKNLIGSFYPLILLYLIQLS